MMKKTVTRFLALTLSLSLLALPALAAEETNVADPDPTATTEWKLTPTDPTAFTDAVQIGQWDAVATLAQLGVIAGKDSGAFDPEGAITRAEAAKLFFYMGMGNGKYEVPIGEISSSFTDMEGHWAARAVEYCQILGIIEGRGDGTFDPDGQVTGSELAKMALVALGYDAATFGLAGDDWQINTNVRANNPSVRLYAGLDAVNPAEPITRQDAAQLLYNMLSATVLWPARVTPAEDEEVTEPYIKYEEKKDEEGNPVSFLTFHLLLTELPTVPQQPVE